MDLNWYKLILLIVMIVGTMAAGLLPMKVLRILRHNAAMATSSKQHKHVSLILCLLTCFSGGVFLATCFLHLFPELQENVSQLTERYHFHFHYPVAELLSCLGFFLLFFLEEVIILLIPSMAHGHSHGTHGHQEHVPLALEVKDSSCCMTGAIMPATATGVPGVIPTLASNVSEPQYSGEENHIAPILSQESASDDAEVAGHCQKHCPLTVHSRRPGSGRTSPECGAPANAEFKSVAFAEPERCERDCEKIDEDPPILMKSSPHAHSHGVRSTTLVLALSIHSIIEGIALGVGKDVSETTALFVSLLVHKLIVAFSVGLQLARTHAHQYRWVVASICILAFMSPIGALVGMVIQSATEQSMGKDILLTILQGLAVGTFLYVTFFEVLLHERDNEHPNLLKLLVIILGFALIGLIRLADNHDHAHNESHEHEDHFATTVMSIVKSR